MIQHLLLASGVEESQLGIVYRAVDKLERDDTKELVNILTRGGLETSIAEQALEIGRVRGGESLKGALGASDLDEVADDFFACVDALSSMGLGDFVDIDLSIVRGLDYYTGVVFELFDAGRSLRAICGGGRYDGLLRALGGVDLPAVGFGMGDVVLGELLRDKGWNEDGATALDMFVVAVTGEEVSTVLSLAHCLRDRGARVEYALKPQSISKQLKIANARAARAAVIIGPDEREHGQVVVRDLTSGDERRIAVGQLTELFATGVRSDWVAAVVGGNG